MLPVRDTRQGEVRTLSGLFTLNLQISCEDFLPLAEHYTECEGNSCVSTLGRFESVMVETKECGPELVQQAGQIRRGCFEAMLFVACLGVVQPDLLHLAVDSLGV